MKSKKNHNEFLSGSAVHNSIFKGNPGLKRTIVLLIAVIVLAVLLEAQVSWIMLKNSAKEATSLLLDQVENVLQDNEQDIAEHTEDLKKDYISYAQTIAYILSLEPEAVYDIDELELIAESLNVDEIHIFDETGTIISGTVPAYYGYSFDSGEQMAYFKPMLSDKTLTMCQDVTPNTAEGKSMMYALVWNKDGTQMIQVGIAPDRLLAELKENEITNVIGRIPISMGYNIYAVDAETETVAASTNGQLSDVTIPAEYGGRIGSEETHSGAGIIERNGSRYYCSYRLIGDYIIAAVYDMDNSSVSFYISILITALYMIIAVIIIIILFTRLYRSNKVQEWHLRQLDDYNRIMSNAGFGLWHIYLKEGAAPRMQANSKMAELLGIEDKTLTEEETYNAWYDHIVPEAVPSVQKSVQEMMDGQFSENTYQWKHPLYGLIYVRCGGTAEKLDDTTTKLSGYHADVTDIVLEEQEYKEKLREAKQDAEAANLAKTAFLFNMSHDIRTPMNAIIGFTDLIEKHYDDKERCMDYLRKCQEANKFLLSLINNVLEMARIESGKMQLDETPCKAGSIANEMFSIFEEQMQAKNIEFTENIELHTEYVLCDQPKVREIYLNILSNAVKYTPEGGKIEMNIREQKSERPGHTIIRTVISDTGIGMSEEFLPHLFDEFSREHTATESRQQGTGLGMPIVKKIIDLMGGTIEVESEQGKGSVFTVTLCVKIADGISDKTDMEEAAVSVKDYSGKRILLAEDNDLNAEIAIAILSDVGFEIERAEDGCICVDMLQNAGSGYYDVILMDVQMPNMDGYEAARTIRAMDDPGRANIPIIAMTANAFESDRNDAFAAGMNAHVAKPIEIPKLMEALSSVF